MNFYSVDTHYQQNPVTVVFGWSPVALNMQILRWLPATPSDERQTNAAFELLYVYLDEIYAFHQEAYQNCFGALSKLQILIPDSVLRAISYRFEEGIKEDHLAPVPGEPTGVLVPADFNVPSGPSPWKTPQTIFDEGIAYLFEKYCSGGELDTFDEEGNPTRGIQFHWVPDPRYLEALLAVDRVTGLRLPEVFQSHYAMVLVIALAEGRINAADFNVRQTLYWLEELEFLLPTLCAVTESEEGTEKLIEFNSAREFLNWQLPRAAQTLQLCYIPVETTAVKGTEP